MLIFVIHKMLEYDIQQHRYNYTYSQYIQT